MFAVSTLSALALQGGKGGILALVSQKTLIVTFGEGLLVSSG